MIKKNPLIVCEIGLNHLGKKKIFYKYLDNLLSQNIHGITLQVVKDSFFKKKKFKNFYLDLDTISDFIDLIKKSKKKVGIAINDIEKIDFCEKKNVDFYKVINADMNNFNLVEKLTKTKNKDIFLSTGKSNFYQIAKVLKKINTKKIKLVHTSFNQKANGMNFKRIQKLRDRFHLPVSYGNHSPHIETIYSSAYFNPHSIFFYVKLNENSFFPDNNHAVKIKDINEIIKKIFQSFSTFKKKLK